MEGRDLLEIGLGSGIAITKHHGALEQLNVLVRLVRHEAEQAGGLLLHVVLSYILELVKHNIEVNGSTVAKANGTSLG